MTVSDSVRLRVLELRRRGWSYGQIAGETGVSRNTVKSSCRREGVTPSGVVEVAGECGQCGKVLPVGAGGRRFCSSTCRLAWWHAHPERLNRKAIYIFTCPTCDSRFESYGNKNRKYCSHPCYIRHRFNTRGGRL